METQHSLSKPEKDLDFEGKRVGKKNEGENEENGDTKEKLKNGDLAATDDTFDELASLEVLELSNRFETIATVFGIGNNDTTCRCIS